MVTCRALYGLYVWCEKRLVSAMISMVVSVDWLCREGRWSGVVVMGAGRAVGDD